MSLSNDIDKILTKMEGLINNNGDYERLIDTHRHVGELFDHVTPEDFGLPVYIALRKRLKWIESQFETEKDLREDALDMMFPDRHDGDFNEDDISF